MLKSTQQHINYWQNRKIDWKQAYFTPDHPHRELIVRALRRFNFTSVYELGCGAGANLAKIRQYAPRVEVGGVDINADAIACAKQMMPDGLWEHGNLKKLFLSDKSADIIMSDMSLIYIGPTKIDKVMKEIKRTCRIGVLFCEFNVNSFMMRQRIRWFDGYNSYNYKDLLEKHGFWDIEMFPTGNPWPSVGHIITARI